MDPVTHTLGDQIAERRSIQRPLTPSLMAKRALQIQADEGILQAPVYKPTGIADEADPIISSSDIGFSKKGRARAGTLPSSWGNTLPAFQTSSAQDSHYAAPQDSSAMNLAQSDSRQHSPTIMAQSSAGAAYTAAQRARSGSLTMPPSSVGNAFGPTFFSSNWQPSRSGLSTMATVEDDPAPNFNVSEDGVSRLSLDASDTLDYLGLADTASRLVGQKQADNDANEQDGYTASTVSRDRAGTANAQPRRPKLSVTDGRSRSSSFLPSSQVPESSLPYAAPRPSNGQSSAGQSLLTAALHHRINHANPMQAAETASDLAATSRPRATSMGVMDRQLHNVLTDGREAQYVDPHRQLYGGSAGYAGVAIHALDRADPSTVSFAAGRNRAGTIAAFSGPGGRQRTEQELLRMTLLPGEANDSRFRPTRPSSAGILDHSSTQYDLAGGTRSSTKSPATTSPFFQPTRSLYVGLLRPNVTTQELLQVFSRYGAVETFRFVPDKECAFINYVEIADAITAKDDINIRLSGRIGLGSAASDGCVRVKFGRPDSAPQTSSVGGPFAPVQDAFGFADLTASDSNPALKGEGTDSSPTRALWVGSIPATTSIESLVSIFAPFGAIESVRVLSGKNCAFVNFERLDDAIIARKALHGRDVLGPEVGSVRIGFAKVPGTASTPSFDPYMMEAHTTLDMHSGLQGVNAMTAEVQLMNGPLENYRNNTSLEATARHALQPAHPGLTRHLSHDSTRGVPTAAPIASRPAGYPVHSASGSIVPSSDRGGVPLPADMKPRATVTDLQLLMQQLDDLDPNKTADVDLVAQSRPLITYYTRIPPVADSNVAKAPDNNIRLKEARKRLENHACSQYEADVVAQDFMGMIVELSSDFIGNTLVQKFFEKCSEPMKKAMLIRLGPHLATIGVHKNGTWAAQKIIDCTHSEDQRALVVQHLRPYVPPLLLDQYGNYVVQKLIPYGSPYCDFIFDAMVDRCWEIAQGRFGARSMRTCLETVGPPKVQIKRVAIAIILNSVPLATSQNGALLITWLLDASAFHGRFRLIAPRLTPHLANLCTHKLASQTIHRIITQRVDLDASHLILRALFDSSRPQLLEEILVDQVHGSQFITKIMLDPQLLDTAQRERFSDDIRKFLIRHKLVRVPPYKPLAINLGLMPASTSTTNTFVGQDLQTGQGLYGAVSLERQLSHMMLDNPDSASFGTVSPHASFEPASFAYDGEGSSSRGFVPENDSAYGTWNASGSAPVRADGRSSNPVSLPVAGVDYRSPLALSGQNGMHSDYPVRQSNFTHQDPKRYAPQQHVHQNQHQFQQTQLPQQFQQSYPRRHSPLVYDPNSSFGN